jgi:hypothetical protein
MLPKVRFEFDPRRAAYLDLKLILLSSLALEPGNLVKDGYFSLVESVGSIEVCIISRYCDLGVGVAEPVSQIMDPKMDSGCLAAGESLDEEYDVTRPISPEEVLGIIDQLLCHEVGNRPCCHV